MSAIGSLPGLGALWRYRSFLRTSILTDFRLRVARSRLGILWLVISPLLQVAIFAFVLSAIMRSRLPGIANDYAYSIYLLSGFLAWYPFVEIINRSVTLFIENANALKKIAFPRMILPIVIVGVAAINNLIMIAVTLLIFMLLGHFPTSTFLWLPVLTILTLALSSGIGLCFGILNVFMRDIGQIIAIALQFGFWLTPIVYVIDILPAKFQKIVALNPVYWLVENYHRVLVYDLPPHPLQLVGLAALAVFFLLLGRFMLRKSQSDMMDAL